MYSYEMYDKRNDISQVGISNPSGFRVLTTRKRCSFNSCGFFSSQMFHYAL